jgi:hypothetical protein
MGGGGRTAKGRWTRSGSGAFRSKGEIRYAFGILESRGDLNDRFLGNPEKKPTISYTLCFLFVAQTSLIIAGNGLAGAGREGGGEKGFPGGPGNDNLAALDFLGDVFIGRELGEILPLVRGWGFVLLFGDEIDRLDENERSEGNEKENSDGQDEAQKKNRPPSYFHLIPPPRFPSLSFDRFDQDFTGTVLFRQ